MAFLLDNLDVKYFTRKPFQGSHFSATSLVRFLLARWKTRGRGPGVVENAGSGGKREVSFFSPKYEFSSIK